MGPQGARAGARQPPPARFSSRSERLGATRRGMKDFQLYQQILGLTEPWRVEQVTLNVPAREVEVRVGYTATLWGCPECQQRMHVHDYEERRWRHLDSCQFQTMIVARVPVVKCPEHGTQTVAVPWAEKYGRFTRLFERLAIDVMLECSITGACSILGMSWDEADGIKQRAVKRGLARKVPAVMARLCVDEKGMGRGQDYLTIVAEVTEDQTTVQYVGEERKQASLDAFWESLTVEQLVGVEAVGMDMWEPYVQSTLAHLPGAASKIVHDPFHLVKAMNEAVNKVRQSEHRRLQAAGDDTLNGTRQVRLRRAHIRLPHVHGDRLDPHQLLRRQGFPKGVQARLVPLLPHVFYRRLLLGHLGHDGQIVLAPAHPLFIDAQTRHHRRHLAGQASLHGALLDPIGFIPAHPQDRASPRDGILHHHINGQPLEQPAEPSIFLRPWHCHRL